MRILLALLLASPAHAWDDPAARSALAPHPLYFTVDGSPAIHRFKTGEIRGWIGWDGAEMSMGYKRPNDPWVIINEGPPRIHHPKHADHGFGCFLAAMAGGWVWVMIWLTAMTEWDLLIRTAATGLFGIWFVVWVFLMEGK